MSEILIGPVSRRIAVGYGLAAVGSLVVGCRRISNGGTTLKDVSTDAAHFSGYLEIAADGTITFISTRSECGQGISVGLAVLIAEELDVNPTTVKIVFAGVNNRIKDLSESEQGGTGGSSSIRMFYLPVRKTAAAVRDMLLEAAAQGWHVARDTLVIQDGFVIQVGTQLKASIGSLAAAAALLAVPSDAKLKAPEKYKYIGKSNSRSDSLLRINGTAEYGIDIKIPGMLSATIVHCPFVSGELTSVDDSQVLTMPGVVSVVKTPYGVAVVADTFWHASNGAKKLVLKWSQTNTPSSDKILAEQTRLVELPGMKAQASGDFESSFGSAVKKVEASYSVPYLPHTTLEPQNCTAWVKADGTCEIWAPTQAPASAADVAAEILGIPVAKIKINTTLLGGGFGRRLRQDYVAEAVHIAKAVPNKPIKVLWQRSEEYSHDIFRPSSYSKMQAGFDATGKLVAWRHRIACSSIYSWLDEQPTNLIKPQQQTRLDPTATEGADDVNKVYSIPNFTCEWHQYEPGVPVFWWRSVGHSQNAFFVESFIDECAAAAHADPLKFRLDLNIPPRWRAVLELIREKSGWSTPAAAGVGRGLAIHASFGSVVAQVVELTVETQTIFVRKVTVVVDCGTAVDSNLVHTQMESSIAQALAAALKQQITVTNGRVDQMTLIDCQPLLMSEMPVVETHIVPSTAAPGGIGEPGVPPLAPAVANAVFALTGKRLRSMPFKLG